LNGLDPSATLEFDASARCADNEESRVLRALVDGAKQGDEEAFGALVRTVGDRCMAIAYRILRDVDLAEDAVQTALITAWRELPTLRDPDRFEPWLHRMLINACYAEARRSKRWAANVRVLETGGASTPDDVLTVDDRDQLERGMRRLPPDQRAVLVLRHYLGLTLPEVADRLGIPVGTAKSRLHYASVALRSALEAEERTSTMSQEKPA
jgi:RNA polymerase sigma-70 factor (ECF subfamily)